MSGHSESVKEWRERCEQAEAKVEALTRQVMVMNHMLEQRDAMIRQAEFDQLAAQAEMYDRQHTPTDESPDGSPPLVPVDGQGGDYESTPGLEAEVE